jgi:uncharacterized protein with PIN domain
MGEPNDICFAAEATLGKLAKWLRILGFDTDYQAGTATQRFVDAAEKERILLTRTRQVRDQNTGRQLVFITANDPFGQVKQVIQALGLVPADTRPFSRCTRCNISTRQVDRDSVQGSVPDYVWETHTEFKSCSGCGRIYWEGSHIQHSHDLIKRFFTNHQ